jgi:protein O-GlcNAc transferase
MVANKVDITDLTQYYGDLGTTSHQLQQLVELEPNNINAWLDLGNVYLGQGNYEKAIETYLHLLTLDSFLPEAYYNLAVAYQYQDNAALGDYYLGEIARIQGDYHQAIDYYRSYLQWYSNDIITCRKLAQCYDQTNQYQLAIQAYYYGITNSPHSEYLYYYLIWDLRKYGYFTEAKIIGQQVEKTLPRSGAFTGTFQSVSALLLPIVYESEAEIDFWRQQFMQGLERLISSIDLATETGKITALGIAGWSTNFFLHYQNQQDLEIQKRYGYLVHQSMAANFPQWSKSLDLPKLQSGEKIKIGYLLGSDVSSLLWGWLRYCDRSQFAIYCYHFGQFSDHQGRFQMYSDRFVKLPQEISDICQVIREDHLHILVFTEIGLNSKITQLAGLKLAPRQCTTWMHPITSGLPTIDYFLSSELIEPPEAATHYSEQLIRLPQLGIVLEKFHVSELTKERANFNLLATDIVYLCCQSIQKYLPQHDYLLARVCQAVPDAKLIFPASHWSESISDKFKQRLERCFHSFGLDFQQYCYFIPRQGLEDFLSLMSICDVFLDTIGWSGGLTTLDAVGCGLPVVTYPGEFFRGRQSLGILQLLEVTETIASSEENYLEIAIKLGLDHEWRWQIIEKLQTNYAQLPQDPSCVYTLENFYKNIIVG